MEDWRPDVGAALRFQRHTVRGMDKAYARDMAKAPAGRILVAGGECQYGKLRSPSFNDSLLTSSLDTCMVDGCCKGNAPGVLVTAYSDRTLRGWYGDLRTAMAAVSGVVGS